ncbi:hypothetical protein [Pseudonocardia acaciae]|uniref:hypothetical protein n=1 Tax=Pseudonocardia acaciae TaxID=551276 RepID=UPI000490CF3B|nr:hypothetical protein [Pseudonocardia acaciae]
MRFVLTHLWYSGYSLSGLAVTGIVTATGLGGTFFHVGTVRELLDWGAWGVLFGVLCGGLVALYNARRIRRARNRAHELIGPSATDAQGAEAVCAAVCGPVPADRQIQSAAARLASDRLEYVPRKSVSDLVTGGVLLMLAVCNAARDFSNCGLVAVGWGILLHQLRSWRVHRRVGRLRASLDR